MHDNRSVFEYLKELPQENLSVTGKNSAVLLYGNGPRLASRIAQVLNRKRYLGEKGVQFTWKEDILLPGRDTDKVFTFALNEVPGGVVHVRNRCHNGWLETKHQINGEDHSALVLFVSSIKDVRSRITRLAIADFGDYIVQKGLTARFVMPSLNYIPEAKR